MSYIQGLFGAGRRRLVFTAAGAAVAFPAMSMASSVYTGLGAASDYSLMDYGTKPAEIDLNNGFIWGSVAVAGSSFVHLKSAFTVVGANVVVGTGATFTDDTANYSNITSVGGMGGHVYTGANLSSEITAIQNAYANDSTLTATQTFSGSSLNSALTVTGVSGVNVIDINGNLTHTLTLNGPANSQWVVNVTGQIDIPATQTGIVTGPLVHTGNVILDYESSSTLIFSGSQFDANLIDPNSAATFTAGSIEGQLYFGGTGLIQFNNVSDYTPTPPILGSMLVLLGCLGGFGLLKNTIRHTGGGDFHMLKLA